MMDKRKAFFTGKRSALAPCAAALLLGLMVCVSLAEARASRVSRLRHAKWSPTICHLAIPVPTRSSGGGFSSR